MQMSYWMHIIKYLSGGKRNGFFIESGAYDGEYLSNSLFFEIERNFTGWYDYFADMIFKS